MELIYPDQPSTRGRDPVLLSLEVVLGDRSLIAELFGPADTSELGVTLAFPIYRAELDDLVPGGLERLERRGWRHLVIDRSDEVVAAVDLAEDESGRPGLARVVGRGPLVDQTAEAIAAAEDLEEDGQFEVRALDAPSLYVAALWLHDGQQSRDIFRMVLEDDPRWIHGEVDLLAELAEPVDRARTVAERSR